MKSMRFGNVVNEAVLSERARVRQQVQDDLDQIADTERVIRSLQAYQKEVQARVDESNRWLNATSNAVVDDKVVPASVAPSHSPPWMRCDYACLRSGSCRSGKCD